MRCSTPETGSKELRSRMRTVSGPKRQICRFEIRLVGIEPEIWRVIEVPKTYAFWDLHVAIQDAMGWLDYHLHEFTILSPGGEEAIRIGIPDDECEEEVMPEWEVPITQHLSGPGDLARYEYDFGDGWLHDVRLVAVEPMAQGAKYPRCVGGARACPPEDCGGVPGYYSFLEVLANPENEEYADTVEWLKNHAENYYPYRPDSFDPSAAKFWDPKKRWKMMMGDET